MPMIACKHSAALCLPPAQRLVSCARDKLQQNFGPQVHTLLHGLGLMGLRAFDDGECMGVK